MAEPAAQKRGAAHLPEQPGQHLRAVFSEERIILFGNVQHHRARLEDTDRGVARPVHQRGDLGVRIHFDEARAELIAFANVDFPCVIIEIVTGLDQLLEQDGDLHAVRRRQRVELVGMFAHRQVPVVGRTGNGTVDIGELTAGFRVLPDFGGRIGHEIPSDCLRSGHVTPDFRLVQCGAVGDHVARRQGRCNCAAAHRRTSGIQPGGKVQQVRPCVAFRCLLS